jgi:hypothetical protein
LERNDDLWRNDAGSTEADNNHYDRLSILQRPTIDFVFHHTKPPTHIKKSELDKKKLKKGAGGYREKRKSQKKKKKKSEVAPSPESTTDTDDIQQNPTETETQRHVAS